MAKQKTLTMVRVKGEYDWKEILVEMSPKDIESRYGQFVATKTVEVYSSITEFATEHGMKADTVRLDLCCYCGAFPGGLHGAGCEG